MTAFQWLLELILRRTRGRVYQTPTEEIDDLDLPARSAVESREQPALSLGVGFLPVEGRISSPFGMRKHPISGAMKLHAGVDIAATRGTPVVATSNGRVSVARELRGYGLTVVIDHAGDVQTLYAHMDAILVSAGEVVDERQVIGVVGATGNVTGPHLHFEVRRNGIPRNPVAH